MDPTGTIDDILAEVARQSTIEDSMEALLAALEAKVVAAQGDPVKIADAFTKFKANNDRAAAAIVANTPAA